MDSIIHWLHIYPLCEIFYFIAIDNWVMFMLTGLNYFRLFRQVYLNLFSCMRSFNHSTSAHVIKSMHIGAKLLLLEHFERDKITKRSRDL